MKTREQQDRYNAEAKAKAAALAIAAGRVPGQVGQPKKIRTEEELREMRRIKSAKWRSENRERARKIGRESMKRASVAKAISEGRIPGKIGPAKQVTMEQVRAKRAEKMRAYYKRNPSVLEKAKIREQEKRDGTFVSKALPRLTQEQARIQNVVMSANRRARLRKNGGRHTKDDIIRLMAEQEGKCAMCHLAFGDNGYHVDHFIPLALGGTNDASNIKLLHPTCNLKKGAQHPTNLGLRVVKTTGE